MHFHTLSICTNCRRLVEYGTPLPDTLIAGDLCQMCFQPDVVGWDTATKAACKLCGPALTARLISRWKDYGTYP